MKITKLFIGIYLFFLCFSIFNLNSLAAGKNYQVGEKLQVAYDDSTDTATIFGTGDMFDYDKEGFDLSGQYRNPFQFYLRDAKHIVNTMCLASLR